MAPRRPQILKSSSAIAKYAALVCTRELFAGSILPTLLCAPPSMFPSNCPQNAVRDSKKPCENSRSTRRWKSLPLPFLRCKHRLLQSLQNRGRSNPSLSGQVMVYRRFVENASREASYRATGVFGGHKLYLLITAEVSRSSGLCQNEHKVYVPRTCHPLSSPGAPTQGEPLRRTFFTGGPFRGNRKLPGEGKASSGSLPFWCWYQRRP